ncbi:alpha/beta fold hydrolase [Allonocardiopsis opalescens]|uniref:Alpha-beta hydrolase superfamily lysophospholipase n=1 Tax=Allonocardiopsis opalescens TaxID=1144618 RepID=A0A2T0Q5P4_9ACTN|nr:alpha/beta fold hydrolase [Allonocardiopsis opalescens]PRX99090.1 alpha-beta hydrolase superfamily lysophospholipase [Allonocardiopsis opalescens]
MRYSDWGERAPRWAGIRSESLHIDGADVHMLTADAAPEAPAGAPVHLLVHPMAGSATNWLDAIRPLTAHGRVIAPDLPGTIAGHTRAARGDAPRAGSNALFLRAFTDALGLDRVVVHGWSMGGLVALLFADLVPARVDGLVLVAPALPQPVPPADERFWNTAGRVLIAAGPPLARGLLRVTGRRLLDLKRDWYAGPEGRAPGGLDLLGGDPSRRSPETAALWSDELAGMSPRRLGDGVSALASAMSAMYVNRAPVHAVIGRLAAPTLLLWGDGDPLIERPLIDDLTARRPDWDLRVFASVGHLLPLEVPDDYAGAVAGWLADRTRAV